MSVTRYAPSQVATFKNHSAGGWIRHEDYAELEAGNAQLTKVNVLLADATGALGAENRALREALQAVVELAIPLKDSYQISSRVHGNLVALLPQEN